MQNNCEIYVDPEEDEVFFGCISEREKNICSKLVKYAGSSPNGEHKLNKTLDGYKVLNEEENIENIPNNEQSAKISKELFINDSANIVTSHNELNTLSEKDEDTSETLSNNTPVELEHNYSTSVKQKIDKSILSTPKSIVRADKDGGFLKVLSEIALVKAEAEGDNIEAAKEGEDKENKIIYSIPMIKITEATPDKGIALSPPKSTSAEFRRFRNIHNSPQSENNVNYKSKSFVENFESEKNLKNKCLDLEIDKVCSDDDKRKSIDLIDFNDFESDVLNVSILLDEEEIEPQQKKVDENEIVIIQDQKRVCEIIKLSDSFKPGVDENPVPDLNHPKFQPSNSSSKASDFSNTLRFSKEAEKIVEVLKKSAADDTLNFTVPEINLEEEENSFLSPETPSAFDETVIHRNNVEVLPEKSYPETPSNSMDNKQAIKSRTVERYQHKLTPVLSQSKLQSLKYFSERRIYNQTESKTNKRCWKKLPLEEKNPKTAEKLKGGKTCEPDAMPSSKIPVFGMKNSKIPVNERVIQPLTNTAAKTPSGKSYKNSKFNHIESPINAYIHNKPTSLVRNVKPDIKKDSVTKVWKTQTVGSVNKVQEKTRQQNPNSALKFPIVEYKSATSYKIERQPESRLPRLAPTVIKLIGSHSPKVLKHEGRFYMNKPKKQSSTDATIVAEQNEVSVVLSQPAQKSNTIK